jgi:NAD(P)H-flavin reductase/hemoglobin-like flavoprotein
VAIDAVVLKDSWAKVASYGGDEVAHYFYSHLFLHYPETREMFAPSMTRQRDRLVAALGRVISNVDRLDELTPYLHELGRDHRKFGALSGHYPAVGASLLATLRYFSGDSWNEELEGSWTTAYGIIAETMIAAAEEAAQTSPPWWDAKVIDVQRPTFDIALLRIQIDGPALTYQPGQSVAVEAVELRPREWRYYSPANAPRDDNTIDFHVRLIPGGPVSTVLSRGADVGERLRLGPPLGSLTLDAESERPVLMVAGGTGLAPMLALVEQLAAGGNRRRTSLFFGVSTEREIYAKPKLTELGGRHDWLTLVTAVSDDDHYPGEHGLIGDVAVRSGDWTGHDVYVCGPPAMVEATIKRLVEHGVPEIQIRYEEFEEN